MLLSSATTAIAWDICSEIVGLDQTRTSAEVPVQITEGGTELIQMTVMLVLRFLILVFLVINQHGPWIVVPQNLCVAIKTKFKIIKPPQG